MLKSAHMQIHVKIYEKLVNAHLSIIFDLFTDPEEAEEFSEIVARDIRKFKQADQNGDGYLSKEEFAAFLHPEEHEHMKDIVVLVS